MKRTIGIMMLVVAVGAVGAQEPPTPPARPARPIEASRPAPAPRVYIPGPARPPMIDIDELRVNAAEVARAAREFERDFERSFSRADVEAVRAQAAASADAMRDMSRELSRAAITESREMAEAAREGARRIADGFRDFAPLAAMAPMAPMAAMPPMPAIAPMAFGRSNDGFRVPLPQWFQGDPADSLYRLAHDVLGRGDYGRAAQIFKDIGQRYPKSSYQYDLPYYEAWARYKIGTTDELQNAAKLLEPRASKLIGTTAPSSSSSNVYFNQRRGTSEGDVVGLYIRVNSVLAQRGNRSAADIVAKAAQAGTNTCDGDEMQVRVEAMGALSQMDPTAALPLLKRVLEKKDECTVELRKRAVFMLGRRGDGEAATLLAAAAKSDPSTSVRGEAISWLPKLQGDAGVNMLEEILRTEQDERIQKSVVRTLVSSDNQRARSSMRALIDRKDAPLALRVEAIGSFNNERATTDDASYLRGLYSRADNDRLKEAIINALGRIGGQENDQWVLNLAKNQNESSQLRATAISRLMRSNIPIADLMKLYDASDNFSIRQQIVSQLERRNEPEAADKLYDIVKNSTVSSIKIQALNALSRRKDSRSQQLITDIIDGKKP